MVVEPVVVVEVVASPIIAKPRAVESDADLTPVASEAEPRDDDDGELPFFIRVALVGGFVLIMLGAIVLFLFG